MARKTTSKKWEQVAEVPSGFALAHNHGFTTNHALNTKTKRTRCGLRWQGRSKKKVGTVWVANAAFINAGCNCKRCFPRG